MTEDKDDQKLVNFLKKYRPIPPDSSVDFEEKMFVMITQESRTQSQKIPPIRWPKFRLFPELVWSISSGIAVALFAILGWNYYGHLSAKVEPLEDPQLEAFLISNWETTMDNTFPEIMIDETPEN